MVNYMAKSSSRTIYTCHAETMDPGQSVDCPAQTVDPRFEQTIHELSQAQHDQSKTYPKPQRLQCRLLNTEIRIPNISLGGQSQFHFAIASFLLSLWSLTLRCTKHGSTDSVDNRWIVAQSMDSWFAQDNPWISRFHTCA